LVLVDAHIRGWLADSPDLVDNIVTGLGAGASAAALLAAAWATLRLVRQIWTKSVGRRRAQARILDQLACGSSRDYIENLLGVPQFTSKSGGLDQNVHCLPGAWVMIELFEDEVVSYSITVRKKSMWYSTKRLMFGNMTVKLGKDTFEKAKPPETLGERSLYVWRGARTEGTTEHLFFGNPGQYQCYWLSYNMAGAGQMNVSLEGGMNYRTGDYASDEYLGEYDFVEKDAPCPDISNITVNTLTVLTPYEKAGAEKVDFMKRGFLGPDHDILRLAGYFAPSSFTELWWTIRERLRNLRSKPHGDSWEESI